METLKRHPIVQFVRSVSLERWLLTWLSVLSGHVAIYATAHSLLSVLSNEESYRNYLLGFALPITSSTAMLLLLVYLAWRRNLDTKRWLVALSTWHFGMTLVLLVLATDGYFYVPLDVRNLSSIESPSVRETQVYVDNPLATATLLVVGSYVLGTLSTMLLFERRKIQLAALQSTLLIIFLLLLATFTQTRDGEVRVKQDNAPDVFFAWTAHPDGCVDYRFTAEGAREIWLGADGLASIEPMNYGRYCGTSLRTLRIITSDGQEASYLVGKLAWPSLDAWWQAVATGLLVPPIILYIRSLQTLFKPQEAESKVPVGVGLWLLLASMAFFFSFRVMVYDQIMMERSQPPQTDDIYTYIWMAHRLQACWESCPSLDRLKQDFTSLSDDKALNNLRTRRSFYDAFYAPLQSLVLTFSYQITQNWGAAYRLYAMMSYGLQAVASALFLKMVWGVVPAAFSLIVLAFDSSFSFLRATPSSMALMIFLIVMVVLVRNPRLGKTRTPILLIPLLLSHTIGRLHALFIVLVGAITQRAATLNWTFARTNVLSLVLIATYWLIAFKALDPSLSYQFDDDYFRTIYQQIIYVGSSTANFIVAEPLFVIIVTLTGFSLRFISRPSLTMPVLFLCLYTLIFVFYRTNIVNDSPSRVLHILRLLIIGSLSYGLFLSLHTTLRVKRFWKLVFAGLALAASLLMLSTIAGNHQSLRHQIENERDSQNFYFNRQAVSRLLKAGDSDQTILYSTTSDLGILDGIMSYVLVHGAHNHPAIFLPMLDETQLRSTEVAEACWLITQIPAVRENGVIRLSYAEGMTVQMAEAQDLANLRVMVAAAGVPYQLILETEGRSHSLTVDASMHQTWQSFSIPSGTQSLSFVLRREGGGKKEGGIMSLRFKDSPEYWAWDVGLRLDYAWERRLNRRSVTANFSIKDIIPPVWPDAEIFDDSSDLLILKRSGC